MKRLLLLGWDAADWKLIHPLVDAGAMPAFKQVIEAGVSGDLLAGQPPVSAVQWTSIATGKRAWQHGIAHAVERAAGAGRAQPVSAASRRSSAVWEILGRAQKQCIVAGWPATHDSQCPNVRVVSDRFAEPTAPPGVRPWPTAARGSYWPAELAGRLDPLRTSPEDIQADLISQFIPDWTKVNQQQDRRIGQLRLFLAADFSYQTALVKLMKEGPWDFAALRLPALGAISQAFLPFHAPAQQPVNEAESRAYRGVIEAAYVLLDRMLHDLIRAAGPETAVMIVSANGVRQPAPGSTPESLRDPMAWKSPYGVFAAAGDGFGRDTLVFGGRVLDVCPTLLTWFGLPIGDDMEGRVLLESFAAAPEIGHVPGWETGTPEAGPAAEAQPPPELDQLARETEWHLAQSCLEAGRHEQALPKLQKVFRSFPERVDYAHALFQAQVALGRLPEAGETLEVLLEVLPEGAMTFLLHAELCVAAKQAAAARSWVQKARLAKPEQPDLMRRLGLLLLKLREWNDLEELAKRALAADENDPIAWLGLAEAQLRKRRPGQAEQSALRAIGLNYFLPDAHFVLARSLVANSKWKEARETLNTLMRIQPGNRSAAAYARRMGE